MVYVYAFFFSKVLVSKFQSSLWSLSFFFLFFIPFFFLGGIFFLCPRASMTDRDAVSGNFPIRCFTCRKVIGHLWNSLLDDAKRETPAYITTCVLHPVTRTPVSTGEYSKLTGIQSPLSLKHNSASQNYSLRLFFKKFGINRYCCKRMFLSVPLQ